MPNWKVPGPGFVQGFWLKNFKSIQEGLKRNLQKCLENGNVSMWVTKWRRILMQKSKENGKAASRCNCGKNFWIHIGYKFVITSRTKRVLDKI